MAKNAATKIEVVEYSDIARGTDIIIPVVIKAPDGTPFDFTGYELYFTMKPVQGDYEYHDARCTNITKTFTVANADHPGRMDMHFNSKETWQDPGDYYFDVMLKHTATNRISRLITCKTTIVAGPTNRLINDISEGGQIFGTKLDILLTESSPIGVTMPLIADPPENIIETFEVYPRRYEIGTSRHPAIIVPSPNIIRTYNAVYHEGGPNVHINIITEAQDDPNTDQPLSGIVAQEYPDIWPPIENFLVMDGNEYTSLHAASYPSKATVADAITHDAIINDWPLSYFPEFPLRNINIKNYEIVFDIADGYALRGMLHGLKFSSTSVPIPSLATPVTIPLTVPVSQLLWTNIIPLDPATQHFHFVLEGSTANDWQQFTLTGDMVTDQVSNFKYYQFTVWYNDSRPEQWEVLTDAN